LISDDDDSFISNTESEGGFGGANADDNGSEDAIPNEGAQGPNFAVDGEGHRRSTRRRDPIQRLVPGTNNIQVNHQNSGNYRDSRIFPLGTNNIRVDHQNSGNYWDSRIFPLTPKTVLKSDANGSLEHFNLWTFQQGLTKLAKLNRDVFTLILGSRQIPP
jgi:hypothetical protein